MEFCCENIWLNIVIFAVGTWILVKGSDIFIDSAAALARLWHVSELVIGLTLVSIGTSLPELATSLYASFCGESDFLVGNSVGSNIANIALILGIGIVGAGRLQFSRPILTRDVPLMLGIFLVTLLLFEVTSVPGKNGSMIPGINWIGGVILLIGCILYILLLLKNGAVEDEQEDTEPDTRKPWVHFLLVIAGLVMVIAGSKAMVDTVIYGAEQLKIDTMIISATVVAFGTSIPELAVTVTGILKKRYDIAVGNIVGSCIFNILLIFGACALVSPLGINSFTGYINGYIMLVTGALLIGFMAIRKKELLRWQGICFLIFYLIFVGFNFRDVFCKIFG